MRLYYGTYGHRISGKLYVYWGDDNLRTGQQVVAPVTNKYGNTYNTMFTIAKSQNEQNAQGEVNRLNDSGIFIKTIGGRDTLSLPGANDPVTGKRLFNSKAAWKRDSDKRYEDKIRARLGLPPLDRTGEEKDLFSLPGGSAPKVKPVKNQTDSPARNRLLRMKETPADTNKTKERLRAMRNKKYPGED